MDLWLVGWMCLRWNDEVFHHTLICALFGPQTSTEFASTYAALILADHDIEITVDKILALTGAASVDVEPI